MSAISSNSGYVHVYRLRARYLVSSEHSDPGRVKAKLDEVVAHGLAEALAMRLAAWFQGADEGVWCVRRLELTMDVDAAWDHDRLTHSWAAQLARALATTLQDGGDGEHVLYFANRAAYLARFVSDLARGGAWERWCYGSFAGLRLLPLSAALRTALTEQPLVGQEALLQLASNEFLNVLQGLSVQDAHRILDAIAEDAADSDELQCFTAVWSIWRQTAGTPLTTEDEWRGALCLYIWTCRENPTGGGVALRTAARTLLRFVSCLNRHRDKLLAALVDGNISAVYEICGPADAEALLPLVHLPSVWVQEVGLALLTGQESQARAASMPTERQHTPFGGLFLLAPLLDALPLREATDGWSDAAETSAATLVRFLLFVQCCGRTRASAVFSDALARDIFSIPPDLSSTILADWQESISSAACATFLKILSDWRTENSRLSDSSHSEEPNAEDLKYLSLPEAFGFRAVLTETLSRAAYGVMRTFARRLPGFAASRPPYLYDNFLACTGSVENEPSRRVVRLGPTPLHLVLNLTGMSRSQYRLQWLDDRPFVLFPEE